MLMALGIILIMIAKGQIFDDHCDTTNASVEDAEGKANPIYNDFDAGKSSATVFLIKKRKFILLVDLSNQSL